MSARVCIGMGGIQLQAHGLESSDLTGNSRFAGCPPHQSAWGSFGGVVSPLKASGGISATWILRRPKFPIPRDHETAVVEPSARAKPVPPAEHICRIDPEFGRWADEVHRLAPVFDLHFYPVVTRRERQRWDIDHDQFPVTPILCGVERHGERVHPNQYRYLARADRDEYPGITDVVQSCHADLDP